MAASTIAIQGECIVSIMQTIARRLSAVAAASFILACSTTAHAAVIGTFDPAFGPSIPNLGFRGTITLDVTSGCYTQGPGYVLTGGTCQITALQAQIDFYNVNANPNNTLTSVFLNGSYFPANYVLGAYFDPQTDLFAGFDSTDSLPFSFSVTDSNSTYPINYNGSMDLFFASGHFPSQIAQQLDPGAYLRNCQRSQDPCSGTVSDPASIRFTTVPEPDAAVLSLIGLGALAVVRRRRRLMR